MTPVVKIVLADGVNDIWTGAVEKEPLHIIVVGDFKYILDLVSLPENTTPYTIYKWNELITFKFSWFNEIAE